VSCVEQGGENSGQTTTTGLTANIDLQEDETVTCTYTNTRRAPPDRKGSLTVKKIATGGNDTFDFNLTGQPSFSLSNGQEKSFTSLPVGDYTISEVNLPRWLGTARHQLQ
jgi:hypothetical protein